MVSFHGLQLGSVKGVDKVLSSKSARIMDPRSFTSLLCQNSWSTAPGIAASARTCLLTLTTFQSSEYWNGEVAASHANVSFAEKHRYAKILNCNIERIEPGIE